MAFKQIFIGLCLMALSSCVIKINMWGLNSNYKASKKECGELFCKEGSELGSNKDSCVIKISNGKVVKTYLSQFGKSVVYLWNAECHGAFCLSLDVARKKCEAQNSQLIVVSEFFDCHKTVLFFDKKQPLICIDPHYYKSDFTSGYLPKFLFDLTGIKNLHLAEGRYFFFENGKFVKEKQILE
jgi:hypothetical protein